MRAPQFRRVLLRALSGALLRVFSKAGLSGWPTQTQSWLERWYIVLSCWGTNPLLLLLRRDVSGHEESKSGVRDRGVVSSWPVLASTIQQSTGIMRSPYKKIIEHLKHTLQIHLQNPKYLQNYEKHTKIEELSFQILDCT